jgi:hypothetical protein
MTFYADRTDYPHIYRDVYWGNFSGSHLTQETINVRNQFIQDFGIKKRCSKVPQYLHEITKRGKFDHTEFYETKDNKYVVVNSPYCISPENEACLIEIGFSKYNQMYSKSATTFVMVLDKRKRNAMDVNLYKN